MNNLTERRVKTDARDRDMGRVPVESRVLIVAPSYFCLGGVATWLDYLLPGLELHGWEPVLGLVSGPKYHLASRYLAKHPANQVREIHCEWGTREERIHAVRSAIRATNASAVLSVNIPDAMLAAAIERRRRPVRAVMTCHGTEPELFQDMKILGSSLDAVICTNRLACALARVLGGVPENRVFHAPYGTVVPTEIPRRQREGKLIIGYSGRIDEPQKRISDLVRIAVQLRSAGIQFIVRIAGTGPAEEQLKRLIAEHKLDDCFEFLGFVSPNSMDTQFYQKCDILLVTSYWETGPIVVWEAMANGLPVVSSKYIGSGLERLLQDDENCLLFEIGDAEQAALQLQRFAQDVLLWNQIRERAYEFAVDRLSQSVSVENWHRILLSIQNVAPLRSALVNDISESYGNSLMVSGLRVQFRNQIRKMLGRKPMDCGSGGEWPHTLSSRSQAESGFWNTARELDQQSEFEESGSR